MDDETLLNLLSRNPALGMIHANEQVYRIGREGFRIRPFSDSAGIHARGYSRALQNAMKSNQYTRVLHALRPWLENKTIYTGVTSNLSARVYQHKQGLQAGFTKQYGCTQLVYY